MPARIAERNLLPVPPGLAPEVAAMVEPLACCLRGVERAGIQGGRDRRRARPGPDRADALRRGAGRGRARRRASAAGRSGASSPASSAPSPARARGADVVIEAVGTAEAWHDALELVRPGRHGRLLRRRAKSPSTRFRLHYEELTLRGAFHHTPRHVRAALAFLASGAYPWERLVTHRVGLEQVAGLFADPPPDLLKAAVLP